MSSIKTIHGFQVQNQSFKSKVNGFTITETVLVEAATPLTPISNIVNALPSASQGPGTTTFNPQQLTFTLGASRHPQGRQYILKELLDFRRDDETEGRDRFWLIELLYETPTPTSQLQPGVLPGGSIADSPRTRKDQQVYNPDTTPSTEPYERIVDPLDRPSIFRQTNNAQVIETFFDPVNNARIFHANGLPIREPVSVPLVNKVFTWTFNISLTTQIPDLWEVEGKCNRLDLTLLGETYSWTIPQRKLRCNSVTVSEEREATDDDEFHYLRVAAQFEYSILRWDKPIYSLHTRQSVPDAEGNPQLIPITINAREEEADEPWPLLRTGAAIPFADIENTPEEDIGVLWAGFIQTSINPPTFARKDFIPVPPSDSLANFISTYNLHLPRSI